ncbi:MAG TPA: hypothetical protein VFD66_13210 [Verrucomicrobiae bacterium]|nr:hypothetical protein [Verrucomicrobiae bacterium]
MARLEPCYKPENVFLYAPALSPEIKRVAVLPLACEDQRPDLADGCATLQSVLQIELQRTRKFEVVSVSPESLRDCTGSLALTGCEILPRNFCDSVRELCGCDAVLLSQLTVFRPYEPLAIGLRMKLVNARTGQTLWAVDELVDAGDCGVLKRASPLQELGNWLAVPGCDEWELRNSPRKFAQYAAAQVLGTLPKR